MNSAAPVRSRETISNRPCGGGRGAGKVAVVFFNALSADPADGVAYASYRFAKQLLAEQRLEKVFCLDGKFSHDLPHSAVMTPRRSALLRAFLAALKMLRRLFPRMGLRGLHEVVYDFWVARNLNQLDASQVFLHRPLFLRTLSAAQKLAMQVWALTSVPHPFLNYSLVKNEQLHLGLRGHSPYANLRRTLRLASVVARADRVVVLHQDIAAFTYRSYAAFVPADRLVPLKHYFSIDLDVFARANSQRNVGSTSQVTFLHLSHMNLIKGVQYLLEAWAQFQSTPLGDRGRLVLVGREDEDIGTLLRTRHAGLRNVERRGYVPDLLSCYGDADVFLSSSIADAGPATVLEAMASGLPVICSTNCGFATLISHGENGLIYDYNDVGALRNQFEWCIEHRADLARLGAKARDRLQGYSIAAHLRELTTSIKDYA